MAQNELHRLLRPDDQAELSGVTDAPGDPTARSLTIRAKGEMVQFSGLVNRGLELSGALKRVEPREEEGPADPWAYLQRQAVKDLRDKDLDKRAAAAKHIVELWAELVTNQNDLRLADTAWLENLPKFPVSVVKAKRSKKKYDWVDPMAAARAAGSRRYYTWADMNPAIAAFPTYVGDSWPPNKFNHLVLPLAESLHALFEIQSCKDEPAWHGREYFPPDERLRKLLLEALSVCMLRLAAEVGTKVGSNLGEATDILGALFVCDSDSPLTQPHISWAKALEELIKMGNVREMGNVEQRLEAAVWLCKHAPEKFDEVERDALEAEHGHGPDGNRPGRLYLVAALIELGHSRSSEAEIILLQVVGRQDDEAAAITRLILPKLDSPETFLQAWCRQICQGYRYSRKYMYVDFYHTQLPTHLILEIIRRRGPGALTALQRARAVSIVPPRPLVEVTYDALNELEDLDLEDEPDFHSVLWAAFDVCPHEDLRVEGSATLRQCRETMLPAFMKFVDLLAGKDDIRAYRQAMRLPVTVGEFLKAMAEYWNEEEEYEYYRKPDLDLAWKCLMQRLERILREAG